MRNPDDGLGKVEIKSGEVFTDFSTHQIRGEIHMVNESTSKVIERITERVEFYYDEIYPKILKLVTNRDDFNVKLGYFEKQSLGDYKQKWDVFFEEIKKQYEEKKWNNPFLARVIYNTVLYLPMQVTTKYLADQALTIRMSSGMLNKFTAFSRLVELSKGKIPHTNTLFTSLKDLIEDAEIYTSNEMFQVDMYLGSGRSTQVVNKRILEEAETYLNDLVYIGKNSPGNYHVDSEDFEMYVDLCTSIIIVSSLLTFYSSSYHKHATAFIHQKLAHGVLPLIKKAPTFIYVESQYETTYLSFEEAIDLLLTSKDRMTLIRVREYLRNSFKADAMFTLLGHEKFQDIQENFKNVVGDTFMGSQHYVSGLFVEGAGLFEESIADLNNNALEVAKSNPHARWIRTMKGEYYVDRKDLEEEEEGRAEVDSIEENTETESETQSQEKDGEQEQKCTCPCPVHGDVRDKGDATESKDQFSITHRKKSDEVAQLIYTSVGDIDSYARLRSLSTVGIVASDKDSFQSNLNSLETVWKKHNNPVAKQFASLSLSPDDPLPHGKLGESIKDEKTKETEEKEESRNDVVEGTMSQEDSNSSEHRETESTSESP